MKNQTFRSKAKIESVGKISKPEPDGQTPPVATNKFPSLEELEKWIIRVTFLLITIIVCVKFILFELSR